MERPVVGQEQREWHTGADTRVPRNWTPEQGLTQQEQEMLLLWLGLQGSKRETFEQIGERFGHSKPWVGKIVKRACVKLAIMHIENNTPFEANVLSPDTETDEIPQGLTGLEIPPIIDRRTVEGRIYAAVKRGEAIIRGKQLALLYEFEELPKNDLLRLNITETHHIGNIPLNPAPLTIKSYLRNDPLLDTKGWFVSGSVETKGEGITWEADEQGIGQLVKITPYGQTLTIPLGMHGQEGVVVKISKQTYTGPRFGDYISPSVPYLNTTIVVRHPESMTFGVAVLPHVFEPIVSSPNTSLWSPKTEVSSRRNLYIAWAPKGERPSLGFNGG